MGCTSSKEESTNANALAKKSIVLTPSEFAARVQMPACPAFQVVAKAVRKGDKRFVKVFLEGWLYEAREYGISLVDEAANNRQYAIWKMLLDYKVIDLNWKRDSGYSILMEAIFAGDNEMLKFLLDCGAAVNDTHLNNWTSVMLAVKEKSIPMLKTILSFEFKGINERTDPEGWSALLLAVNLNLPGKEHIKVEIVKLLLEEGANPNLVSSEGISPLHVMILDSNVEVCKLLIDARADVTRIGKNNKNCMHYASMGGNLEIAKLIFDTYKQKHKSTLQTFLNAQTEEHGWTPLIYCAKLGHTEIGLFLVENGADSSITSTATEKKEGLSPYAMAKLSKSQLLVHVIPPTSEDLAQEELEKLAEEQGLLDSPVMKKSPASKEKEKSRTSKLLNSGILPKTLNPVLTAAKKNTESAPETEDTKISGTTVREEIKEAQIEANENSNNVESTSVEIDLPPSQLELVGPPPMEGFLIRGDGNTNYCVLTGGILFSYDDEVSASDKQNVISTRNISDSTKLFTMDKSASESRLHCENANEFILEDGDYVEKFTAESVEDRNEWIHSLEGYIFAETL